MNTMKTAVRAGAAMMLAATLSFAVFAAQPPRQRPTTRDTSRSRRRRCPIVQHC